MRLSEKEGNHLVLSAYELAAKSENELWKRKISTKSGIMKRMAKKAQEKMNDLIPEKIHHVMTESIKKMVEAALYGSEYLTKSPSTLEFELEGIEANIRKKIDFYKKTAAIEGAGTGAGGFIMGMADFPLLLSIKMKLLFDISAISGYDIRSLEERLFILTVFQLAFSNDDKRMNQLVRIENWEKDDQGSNEIDWKILQQEYRDYIDFVKLLQMVPGIGAAVGAYANFNLLDYLGETAIQAYRIRYFNEKS
jgi:hypothetical protein